MERWIRLQQAHTAKADVERCFDRDARAYRAEELRLDQLEEYDDDDW